MWVRASAGRLERDPRRRMQAFCDLQESILQGEFHEAGLLRVICLPSSLRLFPLDVGQFSASRELCSAKC
jgi:hypothetical protein